MTLNTKSKRHRNLFNQSTDEDYYKPLLQTKSAFDGNYIEYESTVDKNKNLLPEEYLDVIRPYLGDVINDHKNPKKLRVYSGNKRIDYETQYGDWTIQLKMSMLFLQKILIELVICIQSVII